MTTETRPAGYHRAALVNALDGGMCDDCDSACPRCEKARTLVDRHAAEVRAAAFQEAADAIDAETELAKGAGVLEPDRFRPCRDASAQLRRMAAAARPDNTHGA